MEFRAEAERTARMIEFLEDYIETMTGDFAMGPTIQAIQESLKTLEGNIYPATLMFLREKLSLVVDQICFPGDQQYFFTLGTRLKCEAIPEKSYLN